MKIYTKTGDDGKTGLFHGPRVSKDDARIEAYGTVDELNAVLGAVRGAGVATDIDQQLESIQRELFSIGGELASPDPDRHQLRVITEEHVAGLEQWIDLHEATLPPLQFFILPAGTLTTGLLHTARAVCRRAERRVVTLASLEDTAVSSDLVIYLNRLSDLLFVLARVHNQRSGLSDTAWQSPRRESSQDH